MIPGFAGRRRLQLCDVLLSLDAGFSIHSAISPITNLIQLDSTRTRTFICTISSPSMIAKEIPKGMFLSPTADDSIVTSPYHLTKHIEHHTTTPHPLNLLKFKPKQKTTKIFSGQ